MTTIEASFICAAWRLTARQLAAASIIEDYQKLLVNLEPSRPGRHDCY
jgi:hypothetical protein